jgi:hypothetical protein
MRTWKCDIFLNHYTLGYLHRDELFNIRNCEREGKTNNKTRRKIEKFLYCVDIRLVSEVLEKIFQSVVQCVRWLIKW